MDVDLIFKDCVIPMSARLEVLQLALQNERLSFEARHVCAFFGFRPELMGMTRDDLIDHGYRLIANVTGMTEDEARVGVKGFMAKMPKETLHWTVGGDWRRKHPEMFAK